MIPKDCTILRKGFLYTNHCSDSIRIFFPIILLMLSAISMVITNNHLVFADPSDGDSSDNSGSTNTDSSDNSGSTNTDSSDNSGSTNTDSSDNSGKQ